MVESIKPRILVTGFTGFVGKVVVEELCRQQYEGLLPRLSIVLLIRQGKGKTAQQRFDRLQDSICFSRMASGWQSLTTVVEADLEKADLGMAEDVYGELSAEITHIIHCAASVDFDRPLQEAIRSNVDTSRNLLEFARRCPLLRRMVVTSTAYVHTRTKDRIPETLAPLPDGWTADALYNAIVEGHVQEAEILRTSGHANTYTLTKCLGEHLLVQNHGDVPLSIVRPSIINVALEHPFPGFTDSYGSVGGFGALFGTGFLHVMEGDRSTYFDLIPVDLVAQHLIEASDLAHCVLSLDSSGSSDVGRSQRSPVPITHCVAGLDRSGSFEALNSIGLQYFIVHREKRRVHWKYTGPRNLTYHWHIVTSQTIPVALGCWWFGITGQRRNYKLAKLLQRSVKKCNKVFPYFLSNTFDFVNSQSFPDNFDLEKYLWLTAASIHRHLIKRELWRKKDNAEEVLEKE